MNITHAQDIQAAASAEPPAQAQPQRVPPVPQVPLHEKPILTPGETATFLNVSFRTMQRIIADGKLKVSRLSPRMIRIKREDIYKYLNARAA